MRNRRINLSVTDNQYQKIKDTSAACQVRTVTEFCKQVSLGKSILPRPSVTDLATHQTLKELAVIVGKLSGLILDQAAAIRATGFKERLPLIDQTLATTRTTLFDIQKAISAILKTEVK